MMPVMTQPSSIHVQCCIAGGGPAGMMLGFLLARAGVSVLVLEKHADFLRDFRGDTVHPSTLEIIHELGLLDDFLKRPHQKTEKLGGYVGNEFITVADFSKLKVTCPYIAFMPQWDFLNFIADHAKQYPNFHVRMQAEAEELIEEEGRVVGVKVKTPDGILDVRCDLVVGADGRHSTIRELAGLKVRDLGAPIDVFWLRLSWKPGDPEGTVGVFTPGRIMALINRQDYWQCAYVFRKGMADAIQAKGLDAFRADIAKTASFLGDRTQEIKSWDDVKLLTVKIDYLERWWKPGLICIGDAAHAMSPVGGVGINIAVQDAVAAANILARPLKENRLSVDDLQAVQKRREEPARITQRVQIFMQERIINRVLKSTSVFVMPLPLRLARRFPLFRRMTAYAIGIGARPEHVEIN